MLALDQHQGSGTNAMSEDPMPQKSGSARGEDFCGDRL